MKVAVVYALPHEQDYVELELPEGATAIDAVRASGILERHPEIDLEATHRLGIFAKLIKPDQVLADGDRVEIYRPIRRTRRDPYAVEKKRRIREKKARKAARTQGSD